MREGFFDMSRTAVRNLTMSALLAALTRCGAGMAVLNAVAEAKTAGNEDKIEKLKAELEEADAQLLHANEEISDLNKQLKNKPIDVQAAAVLDKLPEEIEKELAELRQLKQNRQIEKYSDCFKVLVADFRQLLTSLAEIEQADPAAGEKYKHATLELISQMSAKL